MAPKRTPTILAQAQDGLGRTVVLTDVRWAHIVEGHEALDGYELALMRAVETADRSRDGNFSGATVLYARGLGPARWLAVVVAYKDGRGEIITAYPQTKEPKGTT